MNNEVAHQLDALQRIAAFSAKLRGHELGVWHTSEGCSQARCNLCRAELRVYFLALQPEMDGAAIERLCDSKASASRAA